MSGPVRTLVVWCPDWPVRALGVPADHAAVVTVANRVVAVTDAARAHDVVAGLRRREAQARCPSVTVLERDESREARAFEAVLAACERFTPRVELTRPGACAFPTRGPSRYFGGDVALAGQVRRRVLDALIDVVPDDSAVGVGAVGVGAVGVGAVGVGVADGPFAAALAARLLGADDPTGRAHDRADDVMVVAPGGSPAFLAPLPVTVLGRPDLTDVLVRLGLRTLGAFAALPAPDVLGRFGADGAAAHRLAAGLDERLPDLRPVPPDLAAREELDPPVERVDQLAFVAKRLADELADRLVGLGLACTRVAVEAQSEHGESCVRLWRAEGALTPAAIADRVRWQLDGWLSGSAATRPTAGISQVALAPDEVVPATGRQLGFWGGATESAERAARALARIEGLLGPAAVAVPEWRGGRGPGEQIALVPAGAVDLAAPRPAADPAWLDAPWPGRVPTPAPAVVHTEPIPVEVLDAQGRPVTVDGRGQVSAPPHRLSVDGGPWSEVRGWAGPWPADERWWDPDTHRRRARVQVVGADDVARLLTVERGRWYQEALYA